MSRLIDADELYKELRDRVRMIHKHDGFNPALTGELNAYLRILAKLDDMPSEAEQLDAEKPISKEVSCGTTTIYICKRCGNLLDVDQNYCEKCGQKIDWRQSV